jgi:hypothetical protein
MISPFLSLSDSLILSLTLRDISPAGAPQGVEWVILDPFRLGRAR